MNRIIPHIMFAFLDIRWSNELDVRLWCYLAQHSGTAKEGGTYQESLYPHCSVGGAPVKTVSRGKRETGERGATVSAGRGVKRDTVYPGMRRV